jgi:hypothetical protein
MRSQFRFAVPRRNEQHQAIDFTVFNTLELAGNDAMMLSRSISFEREFGELN